MNLDERLARLDEAIAALQEVGADATVIVEGRKDRAALRSLGVSVEDVRLVNERGTMEDLIDSVARSGKKVVVLVDWDRTGGRLARRLHDGLVGQVPVDMDVRRRLASACQCQCVEHVPSELQSLRAQVDPRHPPDRTGEFNSSGSKR